MLKKILNVVGVVAVLALLFIGGMFLQHKLEQKEQDLGSGSGYRENTKETLVLTATSTHYGWGEAVSVVYYRNIGVTLGSTNSSGTFKFACSLADDEPTWTGTQDATNTFDFVQLFDTENGSSIDGDTGITLAGSTDVRLFEANSNNFRWCNIYSTSTELNTGTTITKIKPADNQ